MILRKELISIKEVIEGVSADQKPIIEKRRLSLTLDIPEDMPKILVDLNRIIQAMSNLLGNAIKYTPDGGHIKIKAESDSEKIHIRIIDNGIGIKEDHLKKIFQRFYEVAEVTKHCTGKNGFMAGGTGLGLSIVEGIIKAHGGKVWAESEYGKGSIFHVLLPVIRGKICENVPKDKKTGAFGQIEIRKQKKEVPGIKNNRILTILVIGDKKYSINLKEGVPSDKFDIYNAHTSSIGIKEAISKKPDLILIDAKMPSISGFQVCKILKGNVNTMKIPIIIFSDKKSEKDDGMVKESCADGYITKSFRGDEIIKLIERFRDKL